MIKQSNPLGVLVIGRKRPGFDMDWNVVIRRQADEAFSAVGIATVGQDSPVADDQQIAQQMAKIKAAGCDALLILQPSIGNGQLMVEVGQHWPGPIVLWSTPERQDNPKVSSCSLVGQHMLASILRGMGQPFELVNGAPDDNVVRGQVVKAIALCRTVARMHKSKIGTLGAQPPGYIAMGADPLVARRQLGVQFAPQSLPIFLDRVRDFDKSAVDRDVDAVRALKLPMRDVVDADLELQSRFYLAMRAVCDEESLDALAVKEWPEMSNGVGWPYLAFSRLASEGVPVGMEGDADGTLTCLIGQSLGAGPGFITDWLEHDESNIHYWHPGTAPLSMIDKPVLAKHFNIVKPMGVDGPLRDGSSFTTARLWRRDGRYVMTAFEGESVALPRVVQGNSVNVKVDGGGVPALFDRLVHEGMPHHPVLFEGRHADDLCRLARMMNVDWVA